MWTDERVELLQKLWGQGFSASQIASQLQQGVTRNAVIGKIHRLGKRGPGAPKTARARTGGFGAPSARRRPAPEARRPQTGQLAAGPFPGGPPDWALRPHHAAADAEGPGLATSATLAAHMCCWPIGDPDTSDFTFCGRPSDGSRPYCQGHSGLAYKRGSGTTADVNRLFARYL